MNQTQLESKSTKELLALFNALPGVTPVNRFSSRETAVKRILEHLSNAPVEQSTTPVVAEKPAVEANASRRGKIDPRAGSKRAQALGLLNSGASFETMRTTIGWTEPQAAEAIRILRRMGHDVKRA